MTTEAHAASCKSREFTGGIPWPCDCHKAESDGLRDEVRKARDYSIALQRLIEALADGRPLPAESKKLHLHFVAKRAEERIDRLTRQLKLATDGMERIDREENAGAIWLRGVARDTLAAVKEAGNE